MFLLLERLNQMAKSNPISGVAIQVTKGLDVSESFPHPIQIWSTGCNFRLFLVNQVLNRMQFQIVLSKPSEMVPLVEQQGSYFPWLSTKVTISLG
jgi:hypothetical protein